MAPSYRENNNRGLEDFIEVDRKKNGVIYYRYVFPDGRRKSIKRPTGANDAVYKKFANQLARKVSTQLGRHQSEEEAQSLLNEYHMFNEGLDRKEAVIPTLLKKFTEEYLPTKRHRQSTLDGKLTVCRYYSKLWEKLNIYDLSLQQLTKQLNELNANTASNAAYIKHRGIWIDVFKYAISLGFKLDNIAEKTLLKPQGRTVRKRLKHDWFKEIYAVAPDFLQRAMSVALVTLQRRGDLVEILKSDIYPPNLLPEYEIHFKQTIKGAENVEFEQIGFYWTHPQTGEQQLVAKTSYKKAVETANELNERYGLSGPRQLIVIQNKTVKHGDKACIAIELDEGMEKAINLCTTSNVPSPYLVHLKPKLIKPAKREAGNHWSYLYPNYLTTAFTKARDSLEIFQQMPKGERPSFHEIRALGGKLYEDKYGKVKGKQIANILMGHTSFKMTDHYLDGHRIEFTKATTNLPE